MGLQISIIFKLNSAHINEVQHTFTVNTESPVRLNQEDVLILPLRFGLISSIFWVKMSTLLRRLNMYKTNKIRRAVYGSCGKRVLYTSKAMFGWTLSEHFKEKNFHWYQIKPNYNSSYWKWWALRVSYSQEF